MSSQGTRRLHFSVLLGVGSSIMRKVKVSGSVWIRTRHFPSNLTVFPKGIKMGWSYGRPYHPVSLFVLGSRWKGWPKVRSSASLFELLVGWGPTVFTQRSAHLLAKHGTGQLVFWILPGNCGVGLLIKTWAWMGCVSKAALWQTPEPLRGSTSQSLVCL